jgi:serine phosphatase RsbU (regulator of sigma subunit)
MSTRTKIIFVFFLIIRVVYSQNLDSLKKVLPLQKNDTLRLKVLNQLAENAPDGEWQMFNGQMKQLSERLIKKNLTPPEKRNVLGYLAAALTNEGFDHRIKGEYDKALQKYEEGFRISEQLDDKNAMATSFNNMSTVFQRKGQPDKALDYLNKALAIYEENGNKEGLARIYNNLGSIYNSFGNVQKTLDYLTKALKMREELGDKSDIANSLNNVAYVYEQQGDHAKAEEYYSRSLEMRRQLGDKSGMAITYSNLGSMAHKLGDEKKGLNFFFKTLQLSLETGDKDEIAAAYHNIGAVYLGQDLNDSALIYFQRSLIIREELGDFEGLAMTYSLLGAVYAEKGNTNLGLEYGLKALELAKKTNYPSVVKSVSGTLKNIYMQKQDYRNALLMYELHVRMNDSIINSENRRAAIKNQLKYDYDKKAAADSVRVQEEKKLNAVKHEQELHQQRIMVYIAAGAFVFVLIIAVLIFRGLQQKRRSHQLLESSNFLLEETNKEVLKQKELVEEKQKEIIDSINYAQRIQHAVLTGDDVWTKISPDHFILHKPKDIVSGDFYWAYVAQNRKCVWVLGDCTGHGVPGAFMSMLGNSFLNEIVVENHIFNADQVLNRLRAKIIAALEQKGELRKDGMDVAICVWNKIDNTLEFAGANNSLILLRDGQLQELKGDKMPIGKHEGEMKPFTSIKFPLQKNDLIYMYTDGYADQFGGERGKKFKYKSLHALLQSFTQEPIASQKEKLDHAFESWKGGLEQVDDVSVIGIRI